MTEPGLWERAARCYEIAGATAEAARCYRRGGAFRRAADLYTHLGRHHAAAEAYAAARDFDEAAWRLAHLAADVPAGRDLIAEAPVADTPAGPVLRRLVLARCDVDGGPVPESVLAALAEAQASLAGEATTVDPRIQEWSVCLAETVRRFDQVALVYAAAVRGRRPNAAQHWKDWMSRRFGAVVAIPEPVDAPAAAAKGA